METNDDIEDIEDTDYIYDTVELYCPRCGNRIEKCNPEDFHWRYPFECIYCDENFFRFECLNYDEFQSIFNGIPEPPLPD